MPLHITTVRIDVFMFLLTSIVHTKFPYAGGLCYKDTGDLHRAVMDFTACIQLKPNDQRFFNRATTYCTSRCSPFLGRFTDLRLVPLCPGTLQNWTDAITDLSNAISFNPTDAAYFLTRAGVFAQTGQHTKAVDDFGSAVSADPTDHRSYLMRGLYKKSQGDRKGAYTDVDMALKLSQKIAGALEALGLGLDIA
jgi:tetratricopeptide (TPR) repeat protein